MTTYTLAITEGGLLIATVVDGTDIQAAVDAEMAKIGGETFAYDTIAGLTLTDEEPDARPVWSSDWGLGSLVDENGNTRMFAVRA